MRFSRGFISKLVPHTIKIQSKYQTHCVKYIFFSFSLLNFYTFTAQNYWGWLNAFLLLTNLDIVILNSYFLFYCPFFGQSKAHPREIMTEVLKALQELNVCWKKVGHYNMKCRWIPGIPGHHEGMINSMQSNHYFGDESTIIENDGVNSSPNVVKFEVQVNYPLFHSLIVAIFYEL